MLDNRDDSSAFSYPVSAQQRWSTITERLAERVRESIPAVVAWAVVLAPLWLTYLNPIAGLLLVGSAMAFFIVRSTSFGIMGLVNRERVLRGLNQDWLAKIYAEKIPWQQYRVTFMIRAFRERNRVMLRQTLEAIYRANWPHDGARIHQVEVVFATEEDDPITPPIVEELAAEYRERMVVRQVIHPCEPDVLPGPSSAMHYVGRVLRQEAVRQRIDPRTWLIADLDADTILHPQYVPCLVYHHATDPHRNRRVYQPVVLFTTDYWKAPLHSRLSAAGLSVMTLGWNRWPELAFTGAAASLHLLASVDFWPTNSHSQDSGIDLRFRMRYGSAYDVTGLPVTASVYPVMEQGPAHPLLQRIKRYWTSFCVLFRQSARWREGPLDEFIEAMRAGHVMLTLQRLWAGLERDTITLLTGVGFLAAKVVLDHSWPYYYEINPLDNLAVFAMTLVSLLGLAAFWSLLSTPAFVQPTRSVWRTAGEMLLFWVLFTLYLPVLTSIAGLKTATAYALGKRPRGHYTPTPK
jgi:hypothetical protein